MAGAVAAREEGLIRVVEAMSWSLPPCRACLSAGAEEGAAEVVVAEGVARADEVGAGEDADAAVAPAAEENSLTRDTCAHSRFL